MNRNQLTAFVIAYETRKLVRAAETLYVSQPAVSQQLKKLEEELHTELFVHKRGQIIPTNYGELFYPYAKEALDAINRGEEAIHRQKQSEQKLVLYLYSYNGDSAISHAICRFKETHPMVLLDMRRAVPPAEIQITENALYFVNEDWTTNKNIHFTPLYHSHLVCIMRKADAIQNCDYLHIEDIKDFVNYLPPEGNRRHMPPLEELRKCVPEENRRFSPDFSTSLLNISISGGVCICPDYLPISQDLVRIPYCPEYSFSVGFVYAGTPSYNMVEFLDFIKNWYAKEGV